MLSNQVKSYNKLFLYVLAGGVLLRLVILFLPFSILFNRWGSDDLFYYTQIAGNFYESGRFSFDGTSLTNGFQVLFEFLLIPFGKFIHNQPTNSIYVVLSIQIILAVLSVLQLRKLNDMMGFSQQLNLIICSVFLFSPKLISVIFNGTEGGLSFLMIILAFRSYFWLKEGKNLLISSLCFCGLTLTRLDLSLLLFVLFLTGMFNKHRFFDWFRALILPVFAFTLWISLNYQYFGYIIPSSGIAKKLITADIEMDHIQIFLSTFSTSLFSESNISWLLISLSILGGFNLWMNKKSYLNYGVFLIITSILSSVLIVFSVGYFRDWYLIPHFILVVFFTSLGIQYLMTKVKIKWLIPVICLTIIWSEAHVSKREFKGNDFIQAFDEFPNQLPNGKKIGAFNSGLLGASLSAKGYQIINLDGVVNNEIIPFLKNKNIDEYLIENNIHYIIDNKASIDFFLNNYSNPIQRTYSKLNPSSNLVLVEIEF